MTKTPVQRVREREKNDENLVGRATKARMHCKVVDDEFSKSHFFGLLVVERYKQREKKNRRNVFPVSHPWLPKKKGICSPSLILMPDALCLVCV